MTSKQGPTRAEQVILFLGLRFAKEKVGEGGQVLQRIDLWDNTSWRGRQDVGPMYSYLVFFPSQKHLQVKVLWTGSKSFSYPFGSGRS